MPNDKRKKNYILESKTVVSVRHVFIKLQSQMEKQILATPVDMRHLNLRFWIFICSSRWLALIFRFFQAKQFRKSSSN
jgi:hypothetical protein